MTTPNEADWELINAYSDGELPAEEARALEDRMAAEPELREMLDEVRMVSASLAALRPAAAAAAAEEPAPAEPLKPAAAAGPANRNWPPLAVCASLAAAFLIAAAYMLLPQSSSTTAAGLHRGFLDKTYVLSGTDSMIAASLGTPGSTPDMTLADLFLVDVRHLPGGRTAAHYSGRNDCRLTLLSGPAPEAADADGDTRVLDWQAGDRHFTLFATGMDQRRFDAIAGFLRQATQSSTQPGTVLAMKQATDAAAPCMIS